MAKSCWQDHTHQLSTIMVIYKKTERGALENQNTSDHVLEITHVRVSSSTVLSNSNNLRAGRDNFHTSHFCTKLENKRPTMTTITTITGSSSALLYTRRDNMTQNNRSSLKLLLRISWQSFSVSLEPLLRMNNADGNAPRVDFFFFLEKQCLVNNLLLLCYY